MQWCGQKVMTLNASGSYRPSLAVWGSQEEEGVDNFKSCVSATKRKYSNNNNMNSNNMSSKDKLHLHMLNERKQKRQITNGNSKTQETETSQSCALNVLVILVVVAVRDAQGPLETCFYTVHTHTHTCTYRRTTNTYISLWLSVAVLHPWSPAS